MAFSLNLGNIVVSLGMDAKRFEDGVKKVESSWSGMTGKLKTIAGGMAAATALTAGGIAMVAKAASELETELTRAAAVSQGGMKNFQDFKDAAINASAGSAASAKEAAEGLKFLAMAGFSATQSMAALPDVIRLSTAASIDLGRAADIASDILTGFGLQASDLSHVNDVLTLGFTRTNTTLEMLADGMKYVAPAAASAGQSIETMTAAMGLMSNVGVKGSQAGTSLRMAMLRLQEPPKKARDALQALGVQVVDSNGKMRDFVDIIGDLERAQSNFGQADFTAKVAQVVGVEAVSGILGVINQGETALRSLRDEMVAANGTTAELERQMLNTFGGKMQVLQGNVQNLMSTIGDGLLPVLSRITEATTQFVLSITRNQDEANKLSDALKNVLTGFAYLIEGFGFAVQVGARVIGGTMEIIWGYRMLVGFLDVVATGFAMMYAQIKGSSDDVVREMRRQVQGTIDELERLANESGTLYTKSAKSADEFAALTGKMAAELKSANIQITATGAALQSQEAQTKNAARALEQYAKVWGGLRENANLVDAPRFGVLAPTPERMRTPSQSKFAQKDTREHKATRRDKDMASAREEARQAEIRKEVLRWEIAALEERDALNRVELELQAKIAALASRKMSDAERSLQIDKLGLEAEAQRTRLIEQQVQERQKLLALHAQAQVDMLDIDGIGSTAKKQQAEADAAEAEMMMRVEKASRNVLSIMNQFADNLGGFGRAMKPILGGIEAALGGFMEDGPMGALQAGLMSAVTSMISMVMEHNSFQEHIKVLGRVVDDMGLPDILGQFLDSFKPAIGAIAAVTQALKPLMSMGNMFDGFGKMMFNGVKQFLSGILMMAQVYFQAKASILKVAAMITSAMNSIVNQAADMIAKLPFVDRPDTRAINNFARDMSKKANDATESLDQIKEAQRTLADLTYEQAGAIYDEIANREESTQSMRDLNNELRNAPSGYRIALARFRAQDSVRDPSRGAQGGGAATVIQQAMIVADDPTIFSQALRSHAYELTGSTEAVYSSRLARMMRARR